MPEHVLEYAVVRVVPRVEREEFLNVGVILYCRQQKFLQTKLALTEAKLAVFSPPVDLVLIRSYLQAFERICAGTADGGPIARLDIASRFRWLTAHRSTLVQTSRIHPGLCTDPAQALQRLFDQFVG